MIQLPYLILKQKLAAIAALREVAFYLEQDTPNNAGGLSACPAVFLEFLPFENQALGRNVYQATIEVDIHIITDNTYTDDQRIKPPVAQVDHFALEQTIHRVLDGKRGMLSELPDFAELTLTTEDKTVINSISRVGYTQLPHTNRNQMKSIIRYRFLSKDFSAVVDLSKLTPQLEILDCLQITDTLAFNLTDTSFDLTISTNASAVVFAYLTPLNSTQPSITTIEEEGSNKFAIDAATFSFTELDPNTSYTLWLFARTFTGLQTEVMSLDVALPLSEWTSLGDIPEAGAWRDMAGNENILVAVSSNNANAIIYSEDNGATWQPATVPESRQWTSIELGNGLFVAVSNDATSAVNSTFAYSADGKTWTMGEATTKSIWWRIRFINDTFVVVSAGTVSGSGETRQIAFSTDGINFTYVSPPAFAQLFDVAYGVNRYVIVAGQGSEIPNERMLISADLINWSYVNSLDTLSYWQSIRFGNDRFIACTGALPGGIEPRTIAYSFDGENWQTTLLPDEPSLDCVGIAFGRGLFVVVSRNSQGRSFSSVDGLSWTMDTIGINEGVFWIEYINETFICLSTSGTEGSTSNRFMIAT